MSELFRKLARVQASGQLHVAKSATASIGGRRSYAYATLDDVLACVLPALASEGLALVQSVVPLDGQQALKTAIFDEDGTTVESVVVLPGCSDWHSFGSALTYSRRYALAALVGLATDADDDAHATLPDRANGSVNGHGRKLADDSFDEPLHDRDACPDCGGKLKPSRFNGGSYCPQCYAASRKAVAR